MGTMKRRVIYVSDDDWAAYRTEADACKSTISEWLRMAADHYRRSGDPTSDEELAIEKAIAYGADREWPADPEPISFNTRPFTPVPKRK